MQLTENFAIPVGLEDVLAALADPTFQDLRAERMGALRHSTDIKAGGGELYVGVEWELPSSTLPPAAQAMIGPAVTLYEVQRWHRDGTQVSGTLEGSLARVDLRLAATTTLAPAGPGCQKTIDGTLTSTIPLMGRQIEAAAAPFIRQALATEAETFAHWVASRPPLA